MSSAGQQLVAGRIPGERIATTVETADSSTYTTTETVVISVTFPAVVGRTYKATLDTGFESTVADSRFIVRLREDSSTGSVRQQRNVWPDFTGSIGTPLFTTAEYTADATENKTIVATAVRAAGTGTGNMSADTVTPAYLFVDYIRG